MKHLVGTLFQITSTLIIILGRIIGGSLKTTSQADKESLQAGWFSSEKLKSTPIRARDIDRLMEQGKVWYYGDKKHRGLPPAVGHTCVSRRLVLVHQQEGEFNVLVRPPGARGVSRFPVCKMRDDIKSSLKVRKNCCVLVILFRNYYFYLFFVFVFCCFVCCCCFLFCFLFFSSRSMDTLEVLK